MERIARRFFLPSYDSVGYTSDVWAKREKRLSTRFPVRWFLTDTLPDLWEDYVNRPRIKAARFIRYRTWDQYHTVPTGLKPNYYDADTRMFHASFQLLVDYVEIELAALQNISEDEAACGPSNRFYAKLAKIRRKQKRDPEAGLAYLDWEIEESSGNSGINYQADAAKEKKFLYTWWTQYRPERIDCHDDPLIWGEPSDYEGDFWKWNASKKREINLMQKLEAFYTAEDTEMFHRLVEIRSKMWT